ncbi:hydroxymethylglutaryl-CoA lyase [Pseudomonas psychrotolerans L19]|uniref:hydroxymethylglutaryl-CoA lyase n=1 Tax=Pseudomonas TaxID=286 RepID=UPI00023A3D95|nr:MULTISPECIES: hydroxymethylglutaryl-CoA lyase [Pseudomonas]EHK72722.1 hydroxymethylglutaryl-CoA lyase [Pseudomonas psychrotolerans L19]MBA1179225.1 hydroxymethylglutaryl-CoA lyase [Pseudomonas psychrotolerans]MBA1211787.1 hydroxymethylglutaryl-CoA lyase [Pseudomonas psychrotolerans]TCQ92370.1 hydroxymethylglutaryl-CoA lyase [Pseudomonas sp. JUb52]
MSEALPSRVRLVEVGPRDGLQNEPQALGIAERIQLCRALVASGVQHLEVGSFVSPLWVPQMAGTAEVLTGLGRPEGVMRSVLVPNLKGFEAALAAGVDEIAVFAAASEGFSQRNINCSIAESLARFVPVVEDARAAGIRVRGYVSCVLGCPYDGEVATDQVASVTRELLELGCAEVSLGDTIGVGTPGRTRALWQRLGREVPLSQLAGHFHDTYGQALANVYASLLEGVAVFDSSVAGLGGCPYAQGASGNVASEDLVYLLDGLGIASGVDLERLVHAGRDVSALLGRPSQSRVGRARATRAVN